MWKTLDSAWCWISVQSFKAIVLILSVVFGVWCVDTVCKRVYMVLCATTWAYGKQHSVLGLCVYILRASVCVRSSEEA